MTELLSQNEIFDSLPYYDDDLQKFPILKQKVEQELARQPKPPSALHPRVPPPFELFSVREHGQLKCQMSFAHTICFRKIHYFVLNWSASNLISHFHHSIPFGISYQLLRQYLQQMKNGKQD